MVAIEQIAGLSMAYELRHTLPINMGITVVVCASHRGKLECRTNDYVNALEILAQKPALCAGTSVLAGPVPLRRPPLPRRGFPWKRGPSHGCYPWSAGTLTFEVGMPFRWCGIHVPHLPRTPFGLVDRRRDHFGPWSVKSPVFTRRSWPAQCVPPPGDHADVTMSW